MISIKNFSFLFAFSILMLMMIASSFFPFETYAISPYSGSAHGCDNAKMSHELFKQMNNTYKGSINNTEGLKQGHNISYVECLTYGKLGNDSSSNKDENFVDSINQTQRVVEVLLIKDSRDASLPFVWAHISQCNRFDTGANLDLYDVFFPDTGPGFDNEASINIDVIVNSHNATANLCMYDKDNNKLYESKSVKLDKSPKREFHFD